MDTHDINKKKLLRRSVEARHDLRYFILMSVLLLVMLSMNVAMIVAAGHDLRDDKAQLAQARAEYDPEVPTSRREMISVRKIQYDKELRSSSIGTAIAVFLIGCPFVGYYGYRLWDTLHCPDDYEFYEGRLTNPSGTMTRGLVRMDAVFTLDNGRTITRETRGIYSSWFLRRCLQEPVLIAYDRKNDRLAVYCRYRIF